MLVLGRKEQQSITIGDVKITVIRISQGAVRIGIEAPETTRIVRTELLERKQDDKKVA